MKIDKKNKLILTAIVSILVIIIIIIAAIKNIDKKYSESDTTNEQNNMSESTKQKTQLTEEENEELISKLKSVSEAERIRIYLGQYFKYIEDKDYNSAYSVLYPEFKQNYFPTLEDYENYLKEEKLPDMLSISYDDIYRQGKYYIVTITIGDLISKTTTMTKEKTFIVKENGYNDYYISLKK